VRSDMPNPGPYPGGRSHLPSLRRHEASPRSPGGLISNESGGPASGQRGCPLFRHAPGPLPAPVHPRDLLPEDITAARALPKPPAEGPYSLPNLKPVHILSSWRALSRIPWKRIYFCDMLLQAGIPIDSSSCHAPQRLRRLQVPGESAAHDGVVRIRFYGPGLRYGLRSTVSSLVLASLPSRLR
jgi:hypothetical protein